MRASRVDLLLWVLIYIGLALVGLGLALRQSDAWLGLVIGGLGGLSISIGILLIWLRSRTKGTT